MNCRNQMMLCLFALLVFAGCASTKVTGREQLPQPAPIWVYEFAATPADLPADSALAGKHSEDAWFETAGRIATGRKLGASIADCGCGTILVK